MTPRAKTITVPIKAELDMSGGSALTIRPGSTLVLGFPRDTPVDNVVLLKEELEQHLADVKVVVVVGVQSMAAYEPEQVETVSD